MFRTYLGPGPVVFDGRSTPFRPVFNTGFVSWCGPAHVHESDLPHRPVPQSSHDASSDHMGLARPRSFPGPSSPSNLGLLPKDPLRGLPWVGQGRCHSFSRPGAGPSQPHVTRNQDIRHPSDTPPTPCEIPPTLDPGEPNEGNGSGVTRESGPGVEGQLHFWSKIPFPEFDPRHPPTFNILFSCGRKKTSFSGPNGVFLKCSVRTLTLNLNRSATGGRVCSVHRLLTDFFGGWEREGPERETRSGRREDEDVGRDCLKNNRGERRKILLGQWLDLLRKLHRLFMEL